MIDFVKELDVLGLDDYPDIVDEMLEVHDWDDSLNKLRVGTVLTFSLNEKRDEQYVCYVVDELENGSSIFLIRPAWLNKGYDFKVCVDGWENSENPAPTHDEIYSDLYWKREHDSKESFEALCQAVLDIHEGESPTDVLEEYHNDFDFTVGRTPEALLKPLPWLFIEQDIRYWNYTGRNMTIKSVEQLYNGVHIEDTELDPQPLDEIHSTPLAIQNTD